MTFYERYEQLCSEKGFRPQNPKMLTVSGVTSGAVSGWKNNGSLPKGEVLCRLARYFDVTTDYLLGLSEVRNSNFLLTEEESLLIEAYRSATAQGRFNIIHACMSEKREKGSEAASG